MFLSYNLRDKERLPISVKWRNRQSNGLLGHRETLRQNMCGVGRTHPIANLPDCPDLCLDSKFAQPLVGQLD